MIDHQQPAIINFCRLNKLSGGKRKLAPLSTVKQGFINYTELELLPLFWNNEQHLRPRIKQLTGHQEWSLFDVQGWLSYQKPGILITNMLTTVGRGRGQLKINPTGYQRMTTTMELDSRDEPGSLGESDSMKRYLKELTDPEFDATTYDKKGYILRGGIQTDGFRLQLTAFKKKELLSVKFKRLPDNAMPPRLTSTVGGTSDHLTEIRNVVKAKEDVTRLWGCEAKDVKVLGLDLGQAYTVAAHAILPESQDGSVSTLLPSTQPTESKKFFNLAVNQKAVYQPVLKFRRWMNGQKNVQPEGTGQSIQDIERNMPPTKGQDADFAAAASYLENHEQQLQQFYGTTFKKHEWDRKRALKEEFATITDQLLRMVGGCIGEQRKPDNHVVIAVGLGQFTSKSRLSTLHSTFLSYFTNTVRSLGYIIVGANEYYTSKKCPSCGNFVGQITLRRLHCSRCHARFHRDVLAAENICNVVRGHLLEQERPHYLQPVDAKGNFIWQASSTSSSTDDSGNATAVSNNKTTGNRPALPSSDSASSSTTAGGSRKRRSATVQSTSDSAGSSTTVGGSRKRRRPTVSFIAFDVSMVIYWTSSHQCL
jgi:ribosomal protein S27AE